MCMSKKKPLAKNGPKAAELDSPLLRGAGVVGGAVPTAGAGAAEGVMGQQVGDQEEQRGQWHG
jgi:hypothetical protein